MDTPDTEEWEKEFDERFIPNDGNIPTYIENGNDLKDFIRQTISSRDTYWKERVDKYNELTLAVGKKYEDETRHQTALRYIKQAEQPHGDAKATITPITNEDK